MYWVWDVGVFWENDNEFDWKNCANNAILTKKTLFKKVKFNGKLVFIGWVALKSSEI